MLVPQAASRGKRAGSFPVLRPEKNISELLHSTNHQHSSCRSSPESFSSYIPKIQAGTRPGWLLFLRKNSDCIHIWVLLRGADICTIPGTESFLE